MILEALLRLFLSIADTLVSLIPTVTLPDGLLSGISDVTYVTSQFGYFLPIGTLMICLTFIFLLDNIKFVINLFNFIVRKIPTIS